MSTRVKNRIAVILLLLAPCMMATAQEPLFWENADTLVDGNVHFSSAASGGPIMAVAWQQIVPKARGSKDGTISLFLKASEDGIHWSRPVSFYDQAIKYSGLDAGSEPLVYAMTVDRAGRILAAVCPSSNKVVIRQSVDHGRTFSTMKTIDTPMASVAPSLFQTARGEFLLFTTQGATQAVGSGSQQSISLGYSVSSREGRDWSAFKPLVEKGEAGLEIELQPDHVVFDGKDYVVFQARKGGSAQQPYQLYVKTSTNGGADWGGAKQITTFSEKTEKGVVDSAMARNERPRLKAADGRLTLVWERTLPGMAGSQIYLCHLDAAGAPVDAPQAISAGPSNIFANILSFEGREMVFYAERSAFVYRLALVEKQDTTWEKHDLARKPGTSQFPHSVIFKDSPYLFWENNVESASGSVSSLMALRLDTSVDSPQLRAVGFASGAWVNQDIATIAWQKVDDVSGINYYEITSKLNGKPTSQIDKKYDPNTSGSIKTPKDGIWSFEVVAVDAAGNRSAATSVWFTRKSTLPKPVQFDAIATDAKGYIPDSNTFTVSWRPGDDSPLAGYTYAIQELAASRVAHQNPPARPLGRAASHTYTNFDNGSYEITVQAIDAAGNIGMPSTVVVKLDKYRPYTAIYPPIHTSMDELGNMSMTILGKGFRTDGQIREIALRRIQPPELQYTYSAGKDFRVTDDRRIEGLVLDSSNESGSYRIFLKHSSRGDYSTEGAVISFRSPGTVKIGNFDVLLPRWVTHRLPQHSLGFDSLLVVLLLAFLAFCAVMSIRKIAALAYEGRILNEEVMALIAHTPSESWQERSRKMKALEKRGVGLRAKFALLMITLVTIIVLIISVPLGRQQIRGQREALANGLRNNSELLIGTLVSGAEVAITNGADGYATVVEVPGQISAMKEARWATIAGPADPALNAKADETRDFVWASNKAEWKKLADAGTFKPAKEREKDTIAESLVPSLQRDLNEKLLKDMDPYIVKQDVLRGKIKLEQSKRHQDADLVISLLNESKSELAHLNAEVKRHSAVQAVVMPAFDSQKLQDAYLFYKPVIYFNPTDKSFYQGLVRLEVSTENIKKQITLTVRGVIATTAMIAIIAIALGALGAIILANITVKPIKKLVKGVQVIGSTEDKEELSKHVITVGTRDEIGSLADSINEMTKGLVKAAKASKDLTVGKDVQKMFLPLEKDRMGNKGSTAFEDSPKVEVYGYYEGAKGVSGDYFDFKRLDATNYAFIKCDVSGKGVPAALIMVEVATLFISHFKDWEKEKKRLQRLDLLAYRINDMIEERGFKGRFAALIMGILNTDTGVASVCNAGDTLMHVYDARKKKMIVEKLPEAPAAGPMASFMVEMKAPYRQVPYSLHSGDALFLFTDGFEESKRSLRTETFEVITHEVPVQQDAGPRTAGPEAGGADQAKPAKVEMKIEVVTEEFGTERMDGVINAVFTKGKYTLVRERNPVPNEDLTFDFSSLEPTVKNAVLALVAVEKVYRCIPDPHAKMEDKVVVDAKIDEFLQEHFLQYKRYFSNRLESPQGAAYITFTNMKEDEQYDDLTILVIRKK